MADFLPSSYLQLSPFMAAFGQGQERARKEEEHAAKQQELAAIISKMQQEQQFAAQMQPHKLEEASLMNQTKSAQLPGIHADVKTKQLANQYTQGTQPGKIVAENAKNAAVPFEVEHKKLEALGKAFALIGDHLEAVPTDLGQRGQAARGIMNQLGLDENTPMGQAIVKKITTTPPDKLPEELRKISANMITRSADYRKTMDERTAQEEGANSRNKATNATQIEVAKIGARSREAVAEARNKDSNILNALFKSKNYAGAAAAAAAMALNETDPEQKAKLEAYAKLMAAQDLASKQAGATAPGKIDVPGVSGLPQAPTNNPMSTLGATDQPAAPQQPQVKSLADLQRMYPGVDPKRLQQAYKQKFGVDLR